MINVDFYYFEKKMNSTKQPDASTTKSTLSCSLKAGCGIFAPTLQIRSLGSGDPTAYNYCHIAKFDRYYFIDEWTYFEGVWECNLSEDVLATNKVKIGASTCYITRCSDSDYYDGSIKDTYYPTKGGTSINENVATGLFSTGHYIIGVYGGDNNSIAVGPITFYCFSATEMQNFSEYLYSNDFYTLTGTNVEKALFDPIKYIASAFWVPVNAPQSGSGLPVIFGWYEGPSGTGAPFTASRLSSPVLSDITTTVAVPKHPQASTRGSYLNQSPYSRYTLYAGPFGEIPLDSADLASISTLTLKISEMDFTTGYARFLINDSNNKTLAERIEQIGVPVPLAQLSQNIIGAAGSAISGIGSTITNAVTGNVAGAITSAITGIASTAENLLPQFASTGSIGTRCKIYQPFLNAKFLTIVDENLDHKGRPCCSEQEISDLSGYIEVLDGDIEIGGLTEEYDKVKSYLESGFFYE